MAETDEIENNSVVRVIESSLRSVAASLPIAASIAAGWGEYKNYVQENNIKDIINSFLERIIEIEDKIDSKFLETNELKHLVVKTCFLGKEELIEEKRKSLGWFLAHSCLEENIEDSSKEAVLETLIKLSPFDINILASIIYNDQLTNSGNDSYTMISEEWILEEFGEENKENTMISLWYLKSLGVIHGESTDIGRNMIINYIDSSELYSKLEKLKMDYDHLFRENISLPIIGTAAKEGILKDFFEIENRINKRDVLGRNEIREKINEIEDNIQKISSDKNEESRSYARTVLGNKVLEYIGRSE